MLGKKSLAMAFIALAAAVATPALAREPFTQGHPGDTCSAQLRGSIYARGADLKGFVPETRGFGQWPTDAVIECWPDFPAQDAF